MKKVEHFLAAFTKGKGFSFHVIAGNFNSDLNVPLKFFKTEEEATQIAETWAKVLEGVGYISIVRQNVEELEDQEILRQIDFNN